MVESSLTSLTIYTVGHSNVTAKKFIALLKQYDIHVLVDVRSSPYSKYVHQFNREELQSSLESEGIIYKFAGEYLGGRPKDPACYKNGQIPEGHADYLQLVDYPAVMMKEWYQKGIIRLLEIARDGQTAIMCSEEDPARCHRQHLIAQTLLAKGIEVLHIRSNGKLQKAWLIGEKKEEKALEQLTLLTIHPTEEEPVTKQDELELIYEPLDDDIQFAFPDFLTGQSYLVSPEAAKKKNNYTSSKKQEGREEAERERLRKWIEKTNRSTKD